MGGATGMEGREAGDPGHAQRQRLEAIGDQGQGPVVHQMIEE